jgi:hypothetical protein
MGDDLKQHWDRVYRDRAPDQVSWYQARLDFSLDLIRRTEIGPDDAIVDVGGGASTLVDDLVETGLRRVTVVDLSGEASPCPSGRARHKGSLGGGRHSGW